MPKFFKNDVERAAVNAVYKEAERLMELDGEITPGFQLDLSGFEVTFTLQDGISLARALGDDGKGHIWKAAIQNLYGYALLAALWERAKKFNQTKMIQQLVLEAVKDALTNPSKTTAENLGQTYPDLAQAIETLKKDLKLPKREEPTPKRINRKKKELLPTVTIQVPN